LKEVGQEVLRRARSVRLMIFDVDGVLTDGTLWYGPRGEELKAFSAHDGHGLKLLAAAGVALALLSGRRSKAVAIRARELGIREVHQGVADKLLVFTKLLKKYRLTPAAAGFMGDELVDLPVLERCGFACAPREAPEQVRQCAHYVCSTPAGSGAVRELCEFIMRAQGTFERQLREYLA
jgi:3-deoxy-D-manno-octulosonate 8-phosphate phosphatase (KDO 8-P phosphatase)